MGGQDYWGYVKGNSEFKNTGRVDIWKTDVERLIDFLEKNGHITVPDNASYSDLPAGVQKLIGYRSDTTGSAEGEISPIGSPS